MIENDGFHIDMSGRIYENKTLGIALVGTETKEHYGCALKSNLIKLVKKEIFRDVYFKDSARLYAICIYLFVKDVRERIDKLIVCNDEDFTIVKNVLLHLIKPCTFEIINITEYRKRLGRNVGSLADNYARAYRKRALKPSKLTKGRELHIIPVTYTIIKNYWEVLKENNV